MTDAFADVIAANRRYAAEFHLSGLKPVAAAGLAVVTCMDSRIEPLAMLGLKPGDAKIMRNAGARVTTDVLRTLVVATHLLGVRRVMVVPHTKCRMAAVTEAEIDGRLRPAGPRRLAPRAIRQTAAMTYAPAADRYDTMTYRRVGDSGLRLPVISLGLWHNFGDETPLSNQRAILRRAFDLGITHIDLANNYGPPYGAAEANFGRILAADFARHRDELIISTKAGYDMWPGPYGEWGSRKYLLASLDQSLARMGLDYVDIFYSHRFDPDTPLEETMGALDTAVRSGRALYAGISSYSAERTAEAAAILRDLGTPLLIHQPSYSLLNRWVEEGEPGLLDTLEDEGVGCIAFSPLAQGMLTDRYLDGIPADSRAARGTSLSPDLLTDDALRHVRALDEMAAARGQSLAQMALAWVLRDRRVTSALIGASSVGQLDANVASIERLAFTDDELATIDWHAVDAGINLWARSSTA